MYERERKIDGIRAAPLVSVIMPAYNAEKYIEEAVSSVLSQTYKNWELLILDDCSSDCTAEIAEYFASLDTRIRLLRNPQNMGVAKTRNRGFDIAKGEWIALLDSDDVWHSDKLEKQMAVAGRAGADIIYCSYALVNESGAHLSDYIVPETTSYDAMLRESVLSCSTVLLRQLILREHHFSAEHYHRVVNGSRSSNKFKSAKYRWEIYRDVERLSLPRSAQAFLTYALHGMRKHRRF